MESKSIQFKENVRRINKDAKELTHEKNQNDKELVEIKSVLKKLYLQDLSGFSCEAHKSVIYELELNKKLLMEEKERTWRLKRRVLWLEKGDANKSCFH